MKKYITVIPMQNPDNLKKDVYESDNELLRTNFVTCFPVLIPMYNDVQEGETVTLVKVIVDGHDFAAKNKKSFDENLAELKKRKNINVIEKLIHIKFSEDLDNQLDLLMGLIDAAEENDIITADITYGSKAMPIIIRSALAYISGNVSGADVEKIVYGSLNFTNGKMFIYDVSALFYLDKAVESMSRANVKDPKAALRSIIDMGR